MNARRLPVVDLYVEDDECVVLVGDQVVALSSRATAALLGVAEEWTPRDNVVAALLAALGDPPPGLSLVDTTQQTLVELAQAGLVELDT